MKIEADILVVQDYCLDGRELNEWPRRSHTTLGHGSLSEQAQLLIEYTVKI
jgi:hypothetical protein